MGPGKYLFIVSSTYGHLFPAIRIAHLLQSHGAEILFVTARENQVLLDIQGLKCVALSRQPHPFLSTHDWFDGAANCEQYELIRNVSDSFGPDAIVATPLALPAFVVAEACAIPLIVLGYCEYLFPGVGEGASRKQWRIESITGHYNDLRVRLGLPPTPPDPARSPLIGDRHLLRSIAEFADDDDGLPPQVSFVGPLLWEPAYVNYELDRFVAAARDAGEPIFFVQIGRLFEDWALWESLVRLLAELPARFLVDLGRSDYLAQDTEFPDNFYLHPFIPMGHISPHVDGVICSGQTTSVMAALFHGKPVLAIPNSGDGREVADRIVRHGLGQGIFDPDGLQHAALRSFLDAVSAGAFAEKLNLYRTRLRAHDDDTRLFEKVSL